MPALGPHGLAVIVDLLDAIGLGSGGIHIVVTDRAEAVAAEIEARCPAGWVVAPLLSPTRDGLSTLAHQGSDEHGVLLLGIVEPGQARERSTLHVLNDEREWLVRRGLCAVLIVSGENAQAADAAYLELQAQAPDLWSVRSQVHRAVGPDLERSMRDELLDLLSPGFAGDRAAAQRWLDGRSVRSDWVEHRLWRAGPRRQAWLAEAASRGSSVNATADELRMFAAMRSSRSIEPLPSTPIGDAIAPERWPRPAWPSGQLDDKQDVLVRALQAALDRDGRAQLRVLPEDQAPQTLAEAVLTVGLLRESSYRVVLHLDARMGLARAIERCLHEAGDEAPPQGLLSGARRLRGALGSEGALLLITDASAVELDMFGVAALEIAIVACVHGEPSFAFCVAASPAYEGHARWAKAELSSWAGGATLRLVRAKSAVLDLRMALGEARHVVALSDETWGQIPQVSWELLGPASQRVVALELTPGELPSVISRHGELGPNVPAASERLRSLARVLAGEPITANGLPGEEALVEQYRELARERPDAFVPKLATALNNLGVDLDSLGRREEALAATQEAVEHYRKLAEERPGAFVPEMATALNNLGCNLSSLGQQEEALAATQEAVERYRELARERPDAFVADMTNALNNLGWHLSSLGRREEALAATHEAVEHYRELAKERTGAFVPKLANALNNLGCNLSSLDRQEEALAATQEAVERYRELARERPDAFVPDLANALHNLGVDLDLLGRREEALAATQEAVERYRELARERPDAFVPDLARSLALLGWLQRERGNDAERLAALAEGMRILLPYYLGLRAAHEQLFWVLATQLHTSCEAAKLAIPADLQEWVDAVVGEPGEANDS